MENLTIDCETELIGQGRKAPLMACLSACDGKLTQLLSPDDGCDLIERWLTRRKGWLIGHNIAFDLAVILKQRPTLAPHIWRLYDEGRVWDTGIHERLFALYHGWSTHPDIGRSIISQGVSLAQLTRGLLGHNITEQKLDPKSPRFQYGKLLDIPLDQWSREVQEYALEDARITHQIFDLQQERLLKIEHVQRDQYRYMFSFDLQVRAAWALHHLEIWGLRTSQKSVDQWRSETLKKRATLERDLIDFGLLNDKLKRNMKAIKIIVEASYGEATPRTEKGAVQVSGEVLEDSGEEILIKLADWLKLDKLTGTFGPIVDLGTERPINARWNVLVRSGRTSCTKPNLQQLPQSGGLRECFRPRDGYVYVGADYSTAELVALAQVCLNFGYESNMAKAIKSGQDLHLSLASNLAGVTYQQALKLKAEKDPEILNLRKLAKIPNFGLSGGLGVSGLVAFAKGYGLNITKEKAQVLKDAWFARWPEMHLYFEQVKRDVNAGFMVHHYTKRRRGGVGFTDGANSYFQGLVADGAKRALYEVVRASWMKPDSALFGARPVLFIHDEIILEVPEPNASVAADELARLMIEGIKPFLPDLPIEVEAWCSRIWTKGLDEARDSSGGHIIQN